MKRLSLAFLTCGLLGIAIAGCNDSGMNDNPDAAKPLPDGFVATGCTTVDDCSPTPCQTAKCNPVTKQCAYTDKMCPADSECTVGMCDVTANGDCVQKPANDGMTCTAMSGEAGTCSSGTCNPTPSCAGPFGASTVYCDPGDSSRQLGDNTPQTFGGGTAVVGSYACAPNEAGPEVSFQVGTDSSVTTDQEITVSLRLVDDMGVVLADQTTVDLDLIILEDACTATATCMNPADGAGFKGVTAGTSAERITFTAKPGKTYFMVVDGKDMNQVHPFRIEVEACGRCQPTDSTRLACNVSTPVVLSGLSTASGAALITDYMCGPEGGKMDVAAAGKEVPFLYETPDGLARSVTAKVTGASSEVKLLAVPQSFWGDCLGAECIASAASSGGNATMTFSTEESSNASKRYWIIVDASGSTDANFGLEFSCSKACASSVDSLSCNTGVDEVKKVSSTTTGSRAELTQWGPGGAPCDAGDGVTGLNGPEIVVPFFADVPTAATYQIDLVSKSAGVSLTMTILDAGTNTAPACNPELACRTNFVVADSAHSGSHSTMANNKPAAVTFVAEPMHTYFIVVDGVDAAGGDFDLYAKGTAGGTGCQ